MELPDDKKATHSAVGYESAKDIDKCFGCAYFIPSNPSRWQLVRLPIYDSGWCEKYEDWFE